MVHAQSDPPTTAAEPSPAPAFTIPPVTLFPPSDEPTQIAVDPSDAPSDLPSDVPTVLASDSPSEVPSDVPSFVPTAIQSSLPPDDSGAATSSSVPSATPTTPAPTRPNPCKTQETALLGCYGGLGDDYNACDNCLLEALPQGSDCNEIESRMCEGIDSCPCGECTGVIYQFLECAFGNFQGCAFECDGYSFSTDAPTAAPTIPATLLPTNRIVCPTEQAALSACLASDNTEENGCDSCVFGALGSTTSCEQVQRQSCSAIYGDEPCRCGSCRGVMETFLDCLFQDTADCPIDCEGSG